MTEPARPRRLDLSAAIERGALRSARTVHRAADNPTIDSIALISRPEQARRVAPRAAVVIADAAQSRGWLVSSVLRFAWERRASVVVASGDQPDSVLALARRLDITLLSVAEDPTAVALELASDIGAANAAIEAQLIGLIRSVGRESTVDGILRSAATELGELPLELTYRERVVAFAGKPRPGDRSTMTPIRVAGTPDDPVEIRAYPVQDPNERTFARSALELVVPHLRAAWSDAVSTERPDGVSAVAAAGDAADHTVGGRTLLTQLGWKEDELHFVVFLRPIVGEPSRTLSNVVRLTWQRAMGRVSLMDSDDGWVAVLATDDEGGMADAVDLLRAHAAPGLSELGIGIGVSSLESDPSSLHDLVLEARSAARAAQASGAAEIGLFDSLGLTAIGYLFDMADTRAIAHLVVPDFCAAPDLETLAESVAAFLASGSVTSAADALGIHRNTLTMRLDRARALGLPIGDPQSTLAIMALARAFDLRLSGLEPSRHHDDHGDPR
jgi:hypothetical protein